MFGDFYHLALFVIFLAIFLQFSQEWRGILQLPAKPINRRFLMLI